MQANWANTIFQNTAVFGALASSSSEGTLLGTNNEQPIIKAGHFCLGRGRLINILAKGVFSNTGTPTLTFQLRLGTTSGSSYLSGASIGVSAAITTQSGVTNQFWQLDLDLVNTLAGVGSGNVTLLGAGKVESPGGFASPGWYPLEPTTPPTATWTQVIQGDLAQYLNLSATWSASSSSNTIACQYLRVMAMN